MKRPSAPSTRSSPCSHVRVASSATKSRCRRAPAWPRVSGAGEATPSRSRTTMIENAGHVGAESPHLARSRVQHSDLSWHYRCRNESLIAFSNHTLCHGELLTIPATTTLAAPSIISGVPSRPRHLRRRGQPMRGRGGSRSGVPHDLDRSEERCCDPTAIRQQAVGQTALDARPHALEMRPGYSLHRREGREEVGIDLIDDADGPGASCAPAQNCRSVTIWRRGPMASGDTR
jgi:hypothetical protein